MEKKIVRQDTNIGTRYCDGSWDSTTCFYYSDGSIEIQHDHNEPSRELPAWMAKVGKS